MVSHRTGKKTREFDLEEKNLEEKNRSVVTLLASLVRVACRFPENACQSCWPGLSDE